MKGPALFQGEINQLRKYIDNYKKSSPEPLGQFQPNLLQFIFGKRNFKSVQMKGPAIFQGKIILKIAKLHWQIFKIFFSSTTGPISTKLGTKHLWVKVIQVGSNEGLRPLSMGDKNIAKKHWHIFIIFFSRTTGSISIKLDTNHLWIKEIQVCSNQMKGSVLFEGEIITKLRKYIDEF